MSRVLVSEAYDFEFRKRWSPGTRFIINSAWQGNLDYTQNIYNSRYLRRKMKDELELDVLKIVGRYEESLADVECMVSFPKPETEDEMIRRFFYYYGRKFKQNGILYIDGNSRIWTLPTRPNSTYGNMGKLIRGERFLLQNFAWIVSGFMKQTYVFGQVKILTD